jgi:CheY-like chemotaxis protein
VTSVPDIFDGASLSSTILLVEDEPVLRSSIAQGLNKLTNVQVIAAANVAEAVKILDTRVPSLVISDVDLPGATGLELISELERRKIEIPIIFVTAYLKTYRTQIPDRANVIVLEKPIPLEELRSRALRLLGPAGDAARTPFGVVDYVQLACLGRHSVQIDIELVQGRAQVVVHEGELWSSVDPQGQGPEAFKRLAFLKDGTLTCSSLIGPPGIRTITARWEHLVLESARSFDEAQRDQELSVGRSPTLSHLPALADAPRPASGLSSGPRSQPTKVARPPLAPPPPTRAVKAPPLPARPGPPPLPSAPGRGRPSESLEPSTLTPAPRVKTSVTENPMTFGDLWAQGVDALLRRELDVALRAFEEAAKLRPDDAGVQANLLRLNQMGVGKKAGVGR